MKPILAYHSRHVIHYVAAILGRIRGMQNSFALKDKEYIEIMVTNLFGIKLSPDIADSFAR